ncbi:hypothetical protein D9758_005249 [Tetrapyrgos nigripes]|uniref:HAT C-terminal dimerisation domain-containing protein n=1 Tax=Tetrapyrgos nigripes TaxID=182062 RepID=A0A8H5LWY4_9AGAR|nr:hypothetical protein D9758_005249 [Tetrapyrgos nigripes]
MVWFRPTFPVAFCNLSPVACGHNVRWGDSDPFELLKDSNSESSSTHSLASIASTNIVKVVKGATSKVRNVVQKAKRSVKHCRHSGQASEPIEVSDSGHSDTEESAKEENDEDELERLRARWTSPIYAFFGEKPSIEYENGRKYHYFKCKASKCKGKGGVRCYLDGSDRASTSNLKSHAVHCFGADAVDAAIKGLAEAKSSQNTIYSMFVGLGNRVVSISHQMHTDPERHAAVVRWITKSVRLLHIVEDRKLQELMLSGRLQASFPRRKRVAEDIKTAFEHCSERIVTLLKEYPGQISFATDAWTSPNHRAFVAWTIHLQHQGKLLVFLLDIIEVPKSHTGEVLTREFDKMLERHGLQQKILGFCRDNATSNDTQTTALDSSTSNSFSVEGRVRCLNHTMNLAAKALLNGIAGSDDGAEGKLPDDELEDEEEEEEEDLPTLLDNDDILPEREDDEGVDELEGIDDDERATFDWESAEVRAALEKVFKDATIYFSSEQHSSISGIIPAMDRIDDLLTAQTTTAPSSSQPLHSSVKAALRLAKKLMNRYYSRTDESSIYRISMVLHPGLKLEYFCRHKWQQPWINQAEQLTRNAYNEYVARSQSQQAIEETPTTAATLSTLSSPTLSAAAQTSQVNDFMNISVTSSSTVTARDELADYLAMPLENVTDPLMWWWEKQTVFSILSQMALDYHSVPATSTSVERVFLSGRQLLVFTRNRLSGWSICRFLCLGSWSKKDLMQDKDIMDALMKAEEKKAEKRKGKEKAKYKNKTSSLSYLVRVTRRFGGAGAGMTRTHESLGFKGLSSGGVFNSTFSATLNALWKLDQCPVSQQLRSM